MSQELVGQETVFMSDKYNEYLSLGTSKMMEYLSSSSAGDGERNAVISAFSETLSVGINDSSSMGHYEKVIYDASVRYLDKEVSEALSNTNAPYEQYETAIVDCKRIAEIVQIYVVKGWTSPQISNQDISRSESILRERQDSTSIVSKIIDEDRKISELLSLAEKNLEVKICDQLLDLLEDLSDDLAICKRKKVSLPAISNKATKKIVKRVSSLREVAEQKEELYQEISELDIQIHNMNSLSKTTLEQWKTIISLCNQQRSLFSECQKQQWALPSLRYRSVNDIVNRYQHYINMDIMDRNIAASRVNLSSGKQYRMFFANCDQQNINIQTCERNGWAIPELKVGDPRGLSDIVQEEKNKSDKAKKLKRNLTFIAIGCVAIFALIIFARVKYIEGKVKIPFDSLYVVGVDIDEIYDELEAAGFENISKKQDASGWLDSGEVISVSIDNKDSYDKNQYKEPKVSVSIAYSSDNRIYVTDLLKDWKTANYLDVKKTLNDAGFTHIRVESRDTSDKSLDQMMCALSLNDLDYKNERCYLPKNSPIVITYYSLKIGIGNGSNEFRGQDYEEVVSSLEDSGFTNVQTEKISTGWARGNSVISVTVNNSDDYDSNQTFDPGVKIVVKYSSNDRIDATSVMEGWSTQKYNALQSDLKNKDFSNITIKEKATTVASQNLLVASININNEAFNAGDCYVQKGAPIVIEYYVLNIAPGQSASSYASNTKGKYSSVVAELKDMGFINILVYRNNDLINGWITKEGSIDKISINGNDSFSDSDTFRYDAQIIIVVNTFNGKGCEDITAVEP